MHFKLGSAAVVLIFLVWSTEGNQIKKFQECLTHRSVPSSLWVTPESNASHYAFLNRPWNTRKAVVYPLGYFLPKSTPHVQHAVQCGVLSSMKFIPNSGGHSYEAISWGDNSTAIMDFRDMTKISLIPGRNGGTPIAVVQPGALVGHVNAQLWQLGKVFAPIGMCMTVGIGGHAIGGGVGYFTPTYGLAVDNVVEFEMVDAAGIAVTATKHQNPELFWGLRGAGPGYIGIITKIKLRTYRADVIKITFVKIVYKVKDFVQVYQGYQKWLKWARIHEPGVSAGINLLNDDWTSLYPVSARGGILVNLVHIYDPIKHPYDNSSFLAKVEEIFPPGGDRVTTFPEYLPFVSASGYAPVRLPQSAKAIQGHEYQEEVEDDQQEFRVGWPAHSWPNAPTFPKEKEVAKKLNMMRKEYAVPRYFYCKSQFVKRDLTLEEITKLGQLLQTISNNRCWLAINSEVGDVERHEKSEVAYVHRDSVENWAIHMEAVPSDGDVEEGMAWLMSFWEAMQSFDGGETYQNYPDFEVKDYLDRHYGSNLNRLMETKRNWDPQNYFTNPMSIPVPE